MLSDYISHKRAGESNKKCVALSGYEIVEDIEQADIVIIHNEPWQYEKIFNRYPRLKQKYVIAYAVWETDILCDSYREGIQLVDEVWTCSSYSRDAFEKDFKPVTIIPHVVPEIAADDTIVRHLREQLALPGDGLVFYTIADNRSPRKNLKEAIDAFTQLEPAGNARFLIKTPAPLKPGMITDRRIKNLYGMWPDEYIDGLHTLGDCFVSAHHSEGWGMGLSEAMAVGNIAIATAHGGNMDFMSEKNSFPVASHLGLIETKHLSWIAGLWSSSMSWGYIDRNDLIDKMKICIENWPATRKLRKRAIRDMRQFDVNSVAQIIGNRLRTISAKL